MWRSGECALYVYMGEERGIRRERFVIFGTQRKAYVAPTASIYDRNIYFNLCVQA